MIANLIKSLILSVQWFKNWKVGKTLLKYRRSIHECRKQTFQTRNKICKLESNLTKIDETTEIFKSRIGTMQTNMKQFKAQTKHNSLSRDMYNKRFNCLIHGIQEDSPNARERGEQTEQIFRKFLSEDLKLADANSIAIIDIHPLPQHPIYVQVQVYH